MRHRIKELVVPLIMYLDKIVDIAERDSFVPTLISLGSQKHLPIYMCKNNRK